MLEDGVLRIIFDPKRNKIITDWRKFHIEELHNMHSSPNTIRIIKLRSTRLAEQIARETRAVHNGLSGNI
jgi:hypothetical protein